MAIVVRRKARPRKVVSSKASGNQPKANEARQQKSITEIPGLPRSGGPPSVPNGGARKLYSNKKSTTQVEIDAGALRWLWELAESGALDHYRKYNKVSPQLVDAATRALTAVRQAGHKAYPPKKAIVIRKSSTPASINSGKIKRTSYKRK